MNLRAFRTILASSRGPYLLKLASGGEVTIPHIDYVALPGQVADLEEQPTVVGVYVGRTVQFVDLGLTVSVEIPQTRSSP